MDFSCLLFFLFSHNVVVCFLKNKFDFVNVVLSKNLTTFAISSKVLHEDRSFHFTTVLTSHRIWTALCAIFLTLVVAGHIFYCIEKNKNAALRDSSYAVSIYRSLWWASCTISTGLLSNEKILFNTFIT